MTLEHVDILFQLIAFLFAISIHESAHAWTAWRCGDPTAMMLGRITLNPIKHIDPVGTVLMPLIAAITGIPLLGWAKPTPVNPRNFRNLVWDDIKTSVAGPVSNFLVAGIVVLVLAVIAFTSPVGKQLVNLMPYLTALKATDQVGNSMLVPLVSFLYQLMLINVVLAVFNLIPVPPLDGSHVLRHFLSDPLRRAYDSMGIFGLLALVYLGGGLLSKLITPFLHFFNSILVKL
ncbi:MAG TPA: site-2 protease family protein [Terriglobales bacterium]|mgnify:CR=1 FL=1|jgi:Zn-dependent protease|nr:site-2 protease family protein [Terriglobales bacterium]